MTRDPVDRNQLDKDHEAADIAHETEPKGNANQNRSYPAAVVYTMLSRGLRDPRAYADVVRKYPYALREIFLLLNNAFGMAFAQSIMKLAEAPAPATATSQALRPAPPAIATTQCNSRDTVDVTTADSQETSPLTAGDPAPNGSHRESFAVPAADLDIDDAGRTCDLPEDTGVIAQQGLAWRGDWQQRLQTLLAARGFASVKEFATAQPRKNFVDLANELGAGDVAAVQLEWSYLDDAERLGAVEYCARDFLVRVLHEYTKGWPRSDDHQGRSRLASSLATWSASISSHLPEYKELTMPMGFALLDEQLPEGWLPEDASDPVLIDVFRKYWHPTRLR